MESNLVGFASAGINMNLEKMNFDFNEKFENFYLFGYDLDNSYLILLLIIIINLFLAIYKLNLTTLK